MADADAKARTREEIRARLAARKSEAANKKPPTTDPASPRQSQGAASPPPVHVAAAAGDTVSPRKGREVAATPPVARTRSAEVMRQRTAPPESADSGPKSPGRTLSRDSTGRTLSRDSSGALSQDDKDRMRLRMQARKDNLARGDDDSTEGDSSPAVGHAAAATDTLRRSSPRGGAAPRKTSPRRAVSPHLFDDAQGATALADDSPRGVAAVPPLALDRANSSLDAQPQPQPPLSAETRSPRHKSREFDLPRSGFNSGRSSPRPSDVDSPRQQLPLVAESPRSLSVVPVKSAFAGDGSSSSLFDASVDSVSSRTSTAAPAEPESVSAEVQQRLQRCEAVFDALLATGKRLGQVGAAVDAEWKDLCSEWELLLFANELPKRMRGDLEIRFAESLGRWAEFQIQSDVYRFKSTQVLEKCERGEALLLAQLNSSAWVWRDARVSSVLEMLNAVRRRAIGFDSVVLVQLATQLEEQVAETARLKASIAARELRLTAALSNK